MTERRLPLPVPPEKGREGAAREVVSGTRGGATAPSNQTTTLAHLSDLHFGRLDQEVAEGLLEELRMRNPDLIVVSGDFTQKGSESEFEMARKYLHRLPSAPLTVPGNHDIPSYNLLSRFIRPLSRYKRYINDDLYPFTERGAISVIGVNTARSYGWYLDWSRGRLNARQIARIQQRLEGVEPARLKVLVTHHPFIHPPDDRSRHTLGHPKEALKQLADSGIDLVLAGHFHKAYSDVVATRHPEVKSIVVAQASTSTSDRLKAEPNAYNWIVYDSGAISIVNHQWNGERFQPLTGKTYRQEDGEWLRNS